MWKIAIIGRLRVLDFSIVDLLDFWILLNLSIYYIVYNCRRRSCDLVSIGLKDRDSCDSSGNEMETCLM